MQIQSNSFKHNTRMPSKFTCQGADISPQLSFIDVPENTKSLVLIVDDPDAPDPKAPKYNWTHWVIYNLPHNTTELPENIALSDLPASTKPGINDWKITNYKGPCPPIGEHRYYFTLYALDVVLPDLKEPTKNFLLSSIRPHVIEQASIIGLYEKNK